MAVRTLILQRHLQLLLCAEDRLLKTDANACAKIRPLHGRIRAATAATAESASEKIAENITEDITHIAAVEIPASGSGSAVLKCRMTELVILTALLRVA